MLHTLMLSAEGFSDGIDLSQTISPLYWGFVISLLLGGITIAQAYIYFPSRSDRLSLQLIALSMFGFDIASSFLIAQSIFYYLIPYFGSLEPLKSVTPELSAECLISTIITFISQGYFAYQLYVVKGRAGSWIAVVAISLFAFVAFLGGVACVASMYMFKHGVLSNRNNYFAIFFGIAKGFGALTDIVATLAMTLFLKSSDTNLSQTKNVIKSLLQFVIHRGALVTLIQTLLLVTFYAAPTRIYWIAFHINVTKLYVNTFFAMLNHRDSLRKEYTNGKASEWSGSGSGRMFATDRPRITTLAGDHEVVTFNTSHEQAFSVKASMPVVTTTVMVDKL